MVMCCTFIYDYFYSLEVFPISLSRWFSPGVWVTASLLKSPGLSSSVFWAVLNNVAVSMVSTRPLYFQTHRSLYQSSCDCSLSHSLQLVYIVTSMFHSVFNSLAKSAYLSLFLAFFQFYSVVRRRTTKSTILQVLSFFVWLL